MVFDLEASTDAAMCAIFDPAALAHLLTVPWDEMQDSVGLDDGILGKEKAAGNLTFFSIASDGTFRFRFFVDERAPDGLLDQGNGQTRRFLLRVPGGNLCAVGYEYLPSKDSNVSKIEDYKVDKLGQSQRIQPGNYAVEAFSMGASDVSTSRPMPLGCLGCLSVPIVAGAAWYYGGWTYLWVPCFVAAVSVALLEYSNRAAMRKTPDLPDAVYVMTRLPDDADLSGMKGGSLENS